MLASLSAPLTVDVDHEYKYVSPTERKYRRELGDMASSITQNASQIQLKVSKNEIISTINQSAEAVTINANKINLIGNVAIGTTESEAIVTVNGPISTSVIQPSGMYARHDSGQYAGYWARYDANGITTGYSSGAYARYYGGYLAMYDSNEIKRVMLDATGLRFYDSLGNDLEYYPAERTLTAYWKITGSSNWNVRSDSTGSGTIWGTASPGSTYKYLGSNNGWININYSTSHPSAWVAAGSGELIYQ